MHLYTGISALVQPHAREDSREPLDVIANAALLVDDGRLVAAGTGAQITAHPAARAATRTDLGGRAVVPGLIDSHTHVVFAGDRVDEMARRSRGETYEQIAAAGGGIRRSAEALHGGTLEDLVARSLPRPPQT